MIARHVPVLLMACAVGSISGAAQAAPLSAQELLQQFNVITAGDFNGGPGTVHVEGRTLVGGNVTTTNYLTEFKQNAEATQPGTPAQNGTLAYSDYADLIVLGNVSGNATVKGDAVIGSGGAGLAAVDGGTKTVTASAAALAPAGYVETLTAYSEWLGGLDATATSTGFDNKAVFTSTGDITVFSLVETDFTKDWGNGATSPMEFGFDFADSDDVIVMNVVAAPGDTVFDTAFLLTAIDYSKMARVIWNFEGFDQITFANASAGTLLAAGAEVTIAQNVSQYDGTIFAQKLNVLNSEIHALDTKVPEAVPAVPVPAGFPLLLGGLGALALLRRRKA